MILHVDPSLALPVYEQIRSQVVRMALSGTLASGTRLPTIRQLANDLGLAKGTVAKAYALLEQDKVVESQGRKGTFVTGRTASTTLDATALAELALAYTTAVRQLGGSADDAVGAVHEQWIDL